MGVNSSFTNLGVRERQSTYVPLPFEEMYAAMQEKQKRFDMADAYDRESKKQITALSSAIPEHNEYLSGIKNKYLQDMNTLHKTIYDKGSSTYLRKSQDIVDGFISDPNYNLIQESNAAWAERSKTVAQHMTAGKYSRAADTPYLNFRGKNEDGSLKKFVFAGLREKEDFQKMINEGITQTPDEDQENTFFNPKTNTNETIRYKGRSPMKTQLNIMANLTENAKQDMMAEYNTDEKGLRKIIEAKAHSSSNLSVSRKSQLEMGMLNYKLALRKEQRETNKDLREQAADALDQSTFTKPVYNVNSPLWSEDVKGRINADGSIAESGIWGFQNKSKTLETDPNIAAIIKTAKTFNEGNRGTRHIDTKDALLRYRNGAKTNLQVHGFTKPKDAEDALKILAGNQTEVQLYDVNGTAAAPLSDEQKTAVFQTLGDPKAPNQGYVSGVVNSFNSFGEKAYQVVYDGKTYIATMPSTDRIGKQEHQMAQAHSIGRYATVDDYIEIDRNGRPTGKVKSGKYNVFIDPNDPYNRLVEPVK